MAGIGSQDYGGQEVPGCAVCKLEKQESQWYDSVWVYRPENQEAKGVSTEAGQAGSSWLSWNSATIDASWIRSPAPPTVSLEVVLEAQRVIRGRSQLLPKALQALKPGASRWAGGPGTSVFPEPSSQPPTVGSRPQSSGQLLPVPHVEGLPEAPVSMGHRPQKLQQQEQMDTAVKVKLQPASAFHSHLKTWTI